MEFISSAVQKKAELIVFPECAVLGYHPFDLLERPELVEAQEKELEKIHAKIPEGVAVVVGVITKNKKSAGRPYFNSAAVLIAKKKIILFHKNLLPTGDVFDEARFIEPGQTTDKIFTWKKKRFLVTICEDIWAWKNAKGKSSYAKNPLAQMKDRKFDLVINLSASPYFVGKMALREHMVKCTARHFKSPMMYVNMVGAQDEIIYDGRSFVVDAKGKAQFICQGFAEDLNFFDLKTLKPEKSSPKPMKEMEKLRQALVLGIKDFCNKNSLSRVHLGLSGGIDSAVVACLAVDALGSENVSCLALPGPFSAPQSLTLAQTLAQRLSIELKTISISESYEDLKKNLEKSFLGKEFSVAHENLQARLRGVILMAYSNAKQSLLLTTGNKSEYATGYATMYGDMCGGLAPIADLTKTQVYKLAEVYNLKEEIIPREIIDRPPTAELRANQKDQDTLPPYKDLDESVVRIVEESKAPKSKTDHWLLDVLHRTEFKRWQAPPILKASAHSFGRGRRWPITYKLIR